MVVQQWKWELVHGDSLLKLNVLIWLKLNSWAFSWVSKLITLKLLSIPFLNQASWWLWIYALVVVLFFVPIPPWFRISRINLYVFNALLILYNYVKRSYVANFSTNWIGGLSTIYFPLDLSLWNLKPPHFFKLYFYHLYIMFTCYFTSVKKSTMLKLL